MKGNEFFEKYYELTERDGNFNTCLWELRKLNKDDYNDIRVADEAIAAIVEKQAVVLLEIQRLDNMTVTE